MKTTPPPSIKGRKSKKRPAEGDANPIDKKTETLSLANLKLRIQYAFKKWNPKWMRRLKAVNEKLDKMAKTPEEGFMEMCVMWSIIAPVTRRYKWNDEQIQEMKKINSQSDYEAMVQSLSTKYRCLLQNTMKHGRIRNPQM